MVIFFEGCDSLFLKDGDRGNYWRFIVDICKLWGVFIWRRGFRRIWNVRKEGGILVLLII